MSFARKQSVRAALVQPESKGSGEQVFVFQYNPECLTRTMAFLNQNGEINENSGQGVPIQLIDFSFFLDSTDEALNVEKSKTSADNGLHSSLAVLESMVHPYGGEGKEVEQPVLLFVWGRSRVLPVRLVSLKVVEEAFDSVLNPVKARVDLRLRALDRSELSQGSIGYSSLKKHLDQRSAFAALYKEYNVDSLSFVKKLKSNM